MKKDIINSIAIIIISFFFGASVSLAWTAPPAGPTAGDTLPPINTGPLLQTKTGSLGVTGNLSVFGTTALQGNHIYIFGPQSSGGGGGGGSESAYAEPSNSRNASRSIKKIWSSWKDFVSVKRAQAGHVLYIAPTNLNATIDLTTWEVSLTWVDNTNGEGSYIIERKTGSGSFQAIDSIAANSTSYLDFSLPGYGTYTYRVAPTGGHAPSPLPWSNQKSVTLTAVCQDPDATNYNGPLPCTYPPSSDLYVSGSIGLATAPTQKFDALGTMFVKSLTFSGSASDQRRVCADSAGKLVFCPKGSVTFYYYDAFNYNCPLAGCNWTVPDGVYKINFPNNAGPTVAGYAAGPLNVYPTEVLQIIVTAGKSVTITY